MSVKQAIKALRRADEKRNDNYEKTRIIPISAILACSKYSMAASHWIPKHDCGDPRCPMKGK